MSKFKPGVRVRVYTDGSSKTDWVFDGTIEHVYPADERNKGRVCKVKIPDLGHRVLDFHEKQMRILKPKRRRWEGWVNPDEFVVTLIDPELDDFHGKWIRVREVRGR